MDPASPIWAVIPASKAPCDIEDGCSCSLLGLLSFPLLTFCPRDSGEAQAALGVLFKEVYPYVYPLDQTPWEGYYDIIASMFESVEGPVLFGTSFFVSSSVYLCSGKMIKLFKVKDQRKETGSGTGGPGGKKQSAGELRLHKDISELNLPKTAKISFPNGKDDLMNFEVATRPDEGYYLGGTFIFTFQVSPSYPHEPPKVKCKTKVYHPNIDLEGNVCLNILREDWKPVLNINTIIYGLNLLFTQPNDEDPLNRDAAVVLRENPKQFASNVRRAMAGGYVGSVLFPRCM